MQYENIMTFDQVLVTMRIINKQFYPYKYVEFLITLLICFLQACKDFPPFSYNEVHKHSLRACARCAGSTNFYKIIKSLISFSNSPSSMMAGAVKLYSEGKSIRESICEGFHHPWCISLSYMKYN